MQVKFAYPRHTRMKECAIGMARQQQQEAVVASTLALCCQVMVHRDALEKVEVFKYLGRMKAQDNNNTQAVWHQGDMGTRRTGAEKQEHHPTGGSKVLQGSSTGCTPLRQRDVEPRKSCMGTARGVPCSSRLPHVAGSLAKAGGQEPMEVPKDILRPGGMWHGHNATLYQET